MKLSAPIYQLKRRAKLMVRKGSVPLHQALDTIAQEEGFARWSLLSAHAAAGPLSRTLLSQLEPGDLLLLAGRRGQGKTALGLQLLLDAVRLDRKAVLFTLEFTEKEAREHLRTRSDGVDDLSDQVEIVTSEEISADYVVLHLSGAPAGTVAVIDYLQILDQKRNKPPLFEQIGSLGVFAKQSGTILGFISQIDRSFDPSSKPLPDISDIRMPNLVDLGLFNKACFLHDGAAQMQNIG
ncbi:replicative DNA helicase [Rhizobium aquaticum]|uniref:Replicative DNA helicase n=1 Tax=Rhizobium aquaticum TaxID=1549636 RepID=A0ABV2IXZ2_9HYPH